MAILFQGKDLRLTYLSNNSDTTFVIFNHRNGKKHPIETSEFMSFAEGTAHKMGYNEFNISTSRNHWYQTDEIIDVVRLIGDHNQLGAKIITYGSSMGAYASINFAEMLNAHRFLAFSPQYSLHPDLRPHEDTRWQLESELLEFTYDYIHAGAIQDRRGYLFYDKESPDNQHAKLILNKTSAIGFHIPLSRHGAALVLNQSYGLKTLLKEVAEESFDPAKFSRAFEEKFAQSLRYILSNHKENGNLTKLKNFVISKDISPKELRYLLTSSIRNDDIQIKKLALLAYSFSPVKLDNIGGFRALKIEILIQLNLQREAMIEILNSTTPSKEQAERLMSSYRNLSELAIVLPLLTKLEPASFRKSAEKCAKQHLGRSLVLMKYALSLRPNNPYMKKKVVEYERLANDTSTAPKVAEDSTEGNA